MANFDKGKLMPEWHSNLETGLKPLLFCFGLGGIWLVQSEYFKSLKNVVPSYSFDSVENTDFYGGGVVENKSMVEKDQNCMFVFVNSVLVKILCTRFRILAYLLHIMHFLEWVLECLWF